AERGITGPLDLFENPRGMREVFCKGDAAAALTAPLPAESYIMAANVKAFPCLATGQSVVAAGIEMHRRLRGAVDRLSRFRLVIPDTPGLRRQKDDPGRIKPASREAADHSFNFLAAVALIDGEFGLAQFDGERWNDPKVCALMARLEIVNDSAWNRRCPDSLSVLARGADRGRTGGGGGGPLPARLLARPARGRDRDQKIRRAHRALSCPTRARSHHRGRDGAR